MILAQRSPGCAHQQPTTFLTGLGAPSPDHHCAAKPCCAIARDLRLFRYRSLSLCLSLSLSLRPLAMKPSV
eukprot:6395118-Pyramimonas_sp.AAC.1